MKPIFFSYELTEKVKAGTKTCTRRLIKAPSLYAAKDRPSVIRRAGDKYEFLWNGPNTVGGFKLKPPHLPDEIMYVPEAWRCYAIWDDLGYEVEFRDGETVHFTFENAERAQKWAKYLDKPKEHWQSPYFMPREAARTFLRSDSLKVERLFDTFFANGAVILDLRAEGMDIPEECIDCIDCYGHPCCNDLDASLPLNEETGEDSEGGSECGMLDGVRDDFAGIWNSTMKKGNIEKYGWRMNPWVWVNGFHKIGREEALK